MGPTASPTPIEETLMTDPTDTPDASESTPTPPPAGAPAAPLSQAEDQQWAAFTHFGNIILLVPALLIWLIFGKRGENTRVEGKEALNWTINLTASYLICNILALVAGGFGFVFNLIGLALLVANIIFAIMGGVKVNGGGSYRYPVNIRWIK